MPEPSAQAPPATSSAPDPARTVLGVPMFVVVLVTCFLSVMFDGYDLIVYGAVVPALLTYEPWGLDAAQVGLIGSYALVGMFFGAIAAGSLADRFGRRHTMIYSLALYSLAMLGTSVAPTVEIFGALRLVAGLGFGAVVPAAIALCMEWAPADRKILCNGIMNSGFAVGGILAALGAILLLQGPGFRVLFALGGLPLILVVPLVLWVIPESPSFARASRAQRSDRVTRRQVSVELFRGRSLAALLVFGVANFCVGVVVFGMNTWLPQLMARAGYSLNSALAFQLLLNVGAIAGAVTGSYIADRRGARGVSATYFVLASVCICLLGLGLPGGVLYGVVLLAGVGATGTQILLFGYVASHFSALHRGRALGITTAFARVGGVVGPILGGYLVSAGIGLAWNLAAFAAFAIVGAIASVVVPVARRAPIEPTG